MGFDFLRKYYPSFKQVSGGYPRIGPDEILTNRMRRDGPSIAAEYGGKLFADLSKRSEEMDRLSKTVSESLKYSAGLLAEKKEDNNPFWFSGICKACTKKNGCMSCRIF